MSIQIQDLHFAWQADAQNPLLKIEDLRIKPQEKVMLQGPSGSGKSTLLALLGGVVQAPKGKITLLDTQISQLSHSQCDRFRADHMGFIFQIFNLIPYLSVIENILLPLKFSSLKRKRLQDKGLSPKTEAQRLMTALGIDSFGSKHVNKLSVGQQQRVAAARALIGSPEIIIADEPTSALDSDSRKSFLDLLFQEIESTKATLFYVSHDKDLGSYFDRMISIQSFQNQTKEL